MGNSQRNALRIFGAVLVIAAAVLWWRSHSRLEREQAQLRGEEVYASHDCTDCHLPVHALRQKNARSEKGLVQRRSDLESLLQFLESDTRHNSFVLMSQRDREDLIQYLKRMLP